MANVKISDLEELAATPDNADLLEIVDMAPTPTSKKITWANIKAAVLTKDYSCPNNTEKIQYPLPTSAYMLKAGSDGEPVVGTNTDTDVADAVSKKHTQNTDTGTTATSFKINTGGSEADLQTTGLTADRDYTLPDIDTMLAGSVLLAQNTCEIIEYTP